MVEIVTAEFPYDGQLTKGLKTCLQDGAVAQKVIFRLAQKAKEYQKRCLTFIRIDRNASGSLGGPRRQTFVPSNCNSRQDQNTGEAEIV